MNVLIILTSLVAVATAETCSYSSVQCNGAIHTMCKYTGFGPKCSTRKFVGVTSDADKQTIVKTHNDLRRKVAKGQETRGNPGPQPSASNMRELKWDNELATIAQRWADQCTFQHDSCRNVARFAVGQNIYMAGSKGVTPDGKQDWAGAINGWYNEVKDFNKNNINPFHFTSSTGHYTQVVWADTSLVGCGFISYTDDNGWYQKFYVCNYGIAGNWLNGEMYKTGAAGNQCSGKQNNGLCV